jgi:hypothetical protein
LDVELVPFQLFGAVYFGSRSADFRVAADWHVLAWESQLFREEHYLSSPSGIAAVCAQADLEVARAITDKVEENCFISNSITAKVKLTPQFRVDAGA